jgi:large subunit ribosomal protein L29
MKSKEIKELNVKELTERLDAQRELLGRLKMNHAITPLDNSMQIKDTRKVIARIATELRQRELNK